MMKHSFAAIAALLALTAAANANANANPAPGRAQDLAPIRAQRIELGEVAGIAFYTVQPDGFHVVATFAHGETDANPLRVSAVLAAGQSVVFSAPGVDGAAPASVRIARRGDVVVVTNGNAATEGNVAAAAAAAAERPGRQQAAD